MLTVDYARLGVEPGDRLLDLGCGAGRHAYEAMRRGDWSARHHPGVHRIAGQTLGLVGFAFACALLNVTATA